MARGWHHGPHWPGELSELAQELRDRVLTMQENLVELWDKMVMTGGFVELWLLLDEKERTRHLMESLEVTCEKSSWQCDSRAFCPEITIRSMLKRGGLAYTSFTRDYCQGKEDAGLGNVYFLPSVWWQRAMNVSDPIIETMFTIMSLQRNEFVTIFLTQATMSILYDIGHAGSGMDSSLDYYEEGGPFLTCLLNVVACMSNKPVIRCQNCSRTSKEIGCDAKFMLCSPCRSILNISVHYCSKDCQKEDWRKHKMHCGKRNGVKQYTSENGDGTSGSPHASHTHSPALQRQLSLIDADEDADYFLFNDMDQPIRFIIKGESNKLVFRMYRSKATALYPKPGDIGAIAEHLMKHTSEAPGLSRERILAQFNREYGEGTAKMVLEFERRVQLNGYGRGLTTVELMGKGLTNMPNMLKVMDRDSRWTSRQ